MNTRNIAACAEKLSRGEWRRNMPSDADWLSQEDARLTDHTVTRILACIDVADDVVEVNARPLDKLHLRARVGIGGGAPTPGPTTKKARPVSAPHASSKSKAALGPCPLAQLVLAQRARCPIQIVTMGV